MGLKLFVNVILLLYMVIVCGGFYLYRVAVVYPEQQNRVFERHQSDFNAIESAYRNEAEQLSLLLYDWAKWNDLYEYAQSPNRAFEKSNLVPTILEDTGLSAFYILNLKKELVTGMESEGLGALLNKKYQLPTQRLDTIEQVSWPDNAGNRCHFLNYDTSLSLFCMATIQDSNEALPANGYLIFVRSMADEKLTQLRNMTSADFGIALGRYDEAKVMDSILDYTMDDIHHEYLLRVPSEGADTNFVVQVKYPKDTLPVLMDTQTKVLMTVLVLIPLSILYLLSRFVLTPLTLMSQFVVTLKSDGATQRLPRVRYIPELKVFNQALVELMSHVDDERKQLEMMSMTDALTSVKNRRAFDAEAEEFWRSAPRLSKPVLVVLADIDFFKNFNDSLGHQEGDHAIRAVALALKDACRRSTDQLYRYGGEEFAITMTLEKPEDVERVMESFHRAISLLYYPHPSSRVSEYITVSLGVCLIPEPGNWMQHYSHGIAVEIADRALYQAKDSGRNTHVVSVLSSNGVEVISTEGQKQVLPITDFPPPKHH